MRVVMKQGIYVENIRRYYQSIIGHVNKRNEEEEANLEGGLVI